MTINAKSSNPGEVVLLVGIRKGAFIFNSDRDRKEWVVSDLMFKSWNVMHMTLDQRDRRLHAAVVHDVYGPSTHYSDTWARPECSQRRYPPFQDPPVPVVLSALQANRAMKIPPGRYPTGNGAGHH